MSKNWMKRSPPYEGDEPYLYLAFAEADSKRVWKLLRPLLERGCRVWYSFGPAGSAEELLHRQERCERAALTAVYLTDALCADRDTKSAVLVNQKFDRPILCLDPDEKDRRLAMNLRETVPHVPLYRLSGEEWESAVLHADGFSQDMLGEPVSIGGGGLLRKMSLLFCLLAVLLTAAVLAGVRYLPQLRPEPADEIVFTDPVVLSAVREAVPGGVITGEAAAAITSLRFGAMPESWEELALLPSLERIVLPQRALLDGGELPEGDYVIELSRGDGP